MYQKLPQFTPRSLLEPIGLQVAPRSLQAMSPDLAFMGEARKPSIDVFKGSVPFPLGICSGLLALILVLQLDYAEGGDQPFLSPPSLHTEERCLIAGKDPFGKGRWLRLREKKIPCQHIFSR